MFEITYEKDSVFETKVCYFSTKKEVKNMAKKMFKNDEDITYIRASDNHCNTIYSDIRI